MLNRANGVDKETLTQVGNGLSEVVSCHDKQREFELGIGGFNLTLDGIGCAIGRGKVQLHWTFTDDEINRLYASCKSAEKMQSKNVTSRNPMFVEAGLDTVTENLWLIK